MSEENLAMIVNCLRLRKTMYDADSDAAHELKNTVDMLTAKYYESSKQMETFAIWRNHKIIGYCKMSQATADLLNGIQSAVYFGKEQSA